MSVKTVGQNAMLCIVYQIIRHKAFTKIIVEELLRCCPVGFAVLYLVSIAMIVVGHVIEADSYLAVVELIYRKTHPVVVCRHLQRLYTVVEYLVTLGLQRQRMGCQPQKDYKQRMNVMTLLIVHTFQVLRCMNIIFCTTFPHHVYS